MQKTWGWTTTGYTFAGRRSHEEIQQICRGAGLAGIEGAMELFPGEAGGRSGGSGTESDSQNGWRRREGDG